jgi:predicted TIM-barrel fold metal-dependent hydrolase
MSVEPPWMFQRARRNGALVDIDARLRIMDEFDGYQQVLSLSSPTVDQLAPPGRAHELARVGNDALAELVDRYPDRFVGFAASLPMSQCDQAVPYETSVAMARLVFAGLFDHFPDLVVITHHVGGMIPMMEGRLKSGLQLMGGRNPPAAAEQTGTGRQPPAIDQFKN